MTVIGSSPAWPNPGSAQSGYLVEGAGSCSSTAGRASSDACGETKTSPSTRSPSRTGTSTTGATSSPGPGSTPTGPRTGRQALELWLPPGGMEELATFASLWGNDRDVRATHSSCTSTTRKEPFEARGLPASKPQRLPHYTMQAYGFRVQRPVARSLLAYSGDSRADARSSPPWRAAPTSSSARRRSPTATRRRVRGPPLSRGGARRGGRAESCSRTGRSSCPSPERRSRSPTTGSPSRSKRGGEPHRPSPSSEDWGLSPDAQRGGQAPSSTPRSEDRCLSPDAPDLAKRVAHLAHRHVGPGGVDDRGHEVRLLRLGVPLQPGESCLDGGRVAPAA